MTEVQKFILEIRKMIGRWPKDQRARQRQCEKKMRVLAKQYGVAGEATLILLAAEQREESMDFGWINTLEVGDKVIIHDPRYQRSDDEGVVEKLLKTQIRIRYCKGLMNFTRRNGCEAGASSIHICTLKPWTEEAAVRLSHKCEAERVFYLIRGIGILDLEAHSIEELQELQRTLASILKK